MWYDKRKVSEGLTVQIADNPKPLSNEIRQKMEQYREQLLDAGMVEPICFYEAHGFPKIYTRKSEDGTTEYIVLMER